MKNNEEIRCVVTKKRVIDDCHITVEFGYGSELDCMTYTFSPVHDEVGKKVLKLIDSMIKKDYEDHPTLGVNFNGKPSVEDFGRDVMNDLFGD
jgi:hypothetical protein